MNIDLTAVAQGLLGKLAAAGVVAVAASVLSTAIIKSEIAHLAASFDEFRKEVREDLGQLRKDLYVPAHQRPQEPQRNH